MTYNRTLANISKIVNRNWNILQINTEFYRVFKDTSMIAFKSNKNLQKTIRGHTVQQGKVFKENIQANKQKQKENKQKEPLIYSTYAQTNLQKSICYLFNGMHIMENPIHWKILWMPL